MNDNDKKTFKEKWQDKRYQAKIKLSGYSIFVVIAIIMILVEGASNNNNELLITKTNNDIVTNYKYISNKYYVENNDKYILTNINKVYDIIDYEYLDIDNINNYLNNATLENDIYKVYLKDIILNNTSDKYITIKLLDNSVEIDYTYLLNILNNSNYDTFILKIHK